MRLEAMQQEIYTPGHSINATEFMSHRSLASHGAFFLEHLTPGVSVLDCGCGPGTITRDIAARIAPGQVIGIDFATSQIERARVQTALTNVSFQTADVYALPFADETFDRIFSHALLEHLANPLRALHEFHRVLKPGGSIGICSPDWNGLLIAPPSAPLAKAAHTYASLQSRNGGDLHIGTKLGGYLAEAGFHNVKMLARYECYPSLTFIGEYLALQLENAHECSAATVFRQWSQTEGGMFAQAWIAATAQK